MTPCNTSLLFIDSTDRGRSSTSANRPMHTRAYDMCSVSIFQVVEPEAQSVSRAQVEHLQQLTEYVTHLES